ncbi:hypothetical protein ACTXPD_10105 [Vreelandella alkaliphila]
MVSEAHPQRWPGAKAARSGAALSFPSHHTVIPERGYRESTLTAEAGVRKSNWIPAKGMRE